MSSMVMNRQELGQSHILREPGAATTASFRPSTMSENNNTTMSGSNLPGLAGSNPNTQTSSKAPLNFLDQGIWGNGSLGFGAGSSRSANQSATTTRTGSSALLDNSVSDGWNRNPSSSRLLGSSRRPDAPQSTSRPQTANDSVQQTAGAPSMGNNFFSSTRPPTINLNATSSHQAKSSYGANFNNQLSFGQSEQPPAVYTKFDRPAGPGFQNGSFDGVGRSHQGSASQSPSEERRSFIGSAYAAHHSMPDSRNSSLPPSRHGEEQQTYEALPVGTPGPDSYRRQSTPHANPMLGGSSDQLNRATLQFGQMSFGDHRSSQSFSTTNGDFAHTHDNSISDSASYTQFSRRGSRQVDPQALVSNAFQQGFSANGYNMDFQPNGLSRVRTDPVYTGRDLDSRTASIASSRESRRDSAQSRDFQMMNGHMAVNAAAWGQVEQRIRQYQNIQSQIDPHFAQLMRHPNASYMMNTQNMNMHMNMLQPYFPQGAVMNLNMNPQRDHDTGLAFRSALLDDFRNTKSNKKHELREIFGHVVEFSGDQHGSRFIQTKLETANSDEKARIFDEILPECHQLMVDVFGNYVIQKFFEHGDQTQKKILAHKMRGRVMMLTTQMYGCRVVQKALEYVLTAEKAMLVAELQNDVLGCVKDQNGNHVIQCAIESCPAEMISFIFEAFRGQVSSLSGHSYGCRVIQRCLEHGEPKVKRMVMSELQGSLATLVGDQFGNYVVQHVVRHGEAKDRQVVLEIVAGSLETFSKHKFASNVVEKCLSFGGEDFHREVVLQMIQGQDRAPPQDSMILSLIKDSYGNYVIQKMCEVLKQREYSQFIEHLQPEIAKARRMGCGKQVSSIEKKMVRPSTYSHPRHNSTYASRAGSGERTPGLTNSNSAQTSSLNSINGDAVEGAVNSRKNSVHGNTAHH
ncbi:pumilio-family RNA binding repeat-containing protein 1 [Elsinoe australis]|uniref:Pumilio homology domain family member 3 n=1 Tax=Elsinoe australis TaxID=40998 RepID=A0A4U7BBR2_9PEZI|nr:pumilio-family RNA binding repeat-containing protein 1 [Elsinoe australis]